MNLDCWEEIFLDPTELNCQKEAGLEIHLLIPWCQHLVCVEPKEGMYSNCSLNLWKTQYYGNGVMAREAI